MVPTAAEYRGIAGNANAGWAQWVKMSPWGVKKMDRKNGISS